MGGRREGDAGRGGGGRGEMRPPTVKIDVGGEVPTAAVPRNKTSVRKQSQKEAAWAYYAKSFTYLLSWSLVSGLIIILNNWIMHYDGFPFPITLSATGPLFSWVVAALLVLTGHTELERQMTLKTWFRNIFPIGFFTAVTYATGNELYMFLSVSFIQMMKSLSPIVVLFLLVLFRLDVITYPKLCGVLLMTIGMVIACYTEPAFSAKGLVLMFVGEAAEAMRMVFFQHLLGAQQFGLIEGLFYTCPANFFFLCIGIAVFEERSLTEREHYSRVLENPAPYLLVSSLGFLVILTTLGVIQVCGSLTFKAAGQARNVGIICFSVLAFGDKVTAQQAVGYTINLVGFAVYQIVKTKEDVQALQRDFESSVSSGDGAAEAGGNGGEGGGAGWGSDGVRTPLLDKVGSPAGHGSQVPLSTSSVATGWWMGPQRLPAIGGGGGGGSAQTRTISEPESPTVRGNFVQIRAGAELGGIHD